MTSRKWEDTRRKTEVRLSLATFTPMSFFEALTDAELARYVQDVRDAQS
jgi:hypothetical protein